ncbi:Protein CBG27152 [Caenorhabditis briggsae]|uniref:Protein CBG27152 n=1 Tax=Caenorhabditis briggsae TaxID=6238 RepID=B6IL62_CAEBR|nr:Protein CBG27152 [Caenorhabditis briggsae]CAS00615.1 Protein CBG27152 [Caenorhabditis briggsae]
MNPKKERYQEICDNFNSPEAFPFQEKIHKTFAETSLKLTQQLCESLHVDVKMFKQRAGIIDEIDLLMNVSSFMGKTARLF